MAALKFLPNCDIKRLKIYDRNPRLNDDAVPGVAASIEAFGFISPIIVDKDFRICVGHTRLKAALEKNLKTVPVIVAPDLVGEKFVGYNIADNQTATKAEWEKALLASIIDELGAAGIALASVGFEKDELEELLASLENGDPIPGATDPDDVPEPPKKPITKKGDIWSLGNHRLYCGDCTDPANVKRLMAGKRCDMVFTDPPYGVDFKYESYDDSITKDEHRVFCKKWFEIIKSVSEFIVITVGFGNEHIFYELDRSFHCLVWHKKFSVSSSSIAFARVTEPIFVLGKPKYKRYNTDFFQFGTDRVPGLHNEHPRPKPVALLEALIQPQTKIGGLVLDIFVGSGTTIIACERLNRKCYAMEIDPIYCDVTIKRWEAFTGKKAVKVKT